MPKTVISLRGIRKQFGRLDVLADTDLTLYGGSIVRLSGRNGSGKSTLLRILAGDLSPDSGAIEIDGVVRGTLTVSAARSLGISVAYQDLALCDHLTVLENIFLGREVRLHKARLVPLGLPDRNAMRSVAEDMVNRLGVSLDVRGTSLLGLSGGQRQAIALCRALVPTSRVLLLDEPTAALDAFVRARVYGIIEERRAAGTAVMLISHEDISAVLPTAVNVQLDDGNLRQV